MEREGVERADRGDAGTQRRGFRAIVFGRVQGVGFRWFVRESARSLRVDGFVQNRADGSVLVEAHGEAARLDALLLALRTGPAGAAVDHVDVESVPAHAPGDQPAGFVILR